MAFVFHVDEHCREKGVGSVFVVVARTQNERAKKGFPFAPVRAFVHEFSLFLFFLLLVLFLTDRERRERGGGDARVLCVH